MPVGRSLGVGWMDACRP